MKNIKVISGIVVTLAIGGCTSTWKPYKPPVENLVGMNAKLTGVDLLVGSQMQFQGDKDMEIETRASSDLESEVHENDVNAALDVLLGKVSVKLGLDSSSSTSIYASEIEADTIKNWAWATPGQTFVYGGLRAKSVTIDTKTNVRLNAGQISYPEIGTLDISVTSPDEYKVTINNPKVYYKIQLAEVEQTFSGSKYSTGWITMDSLGNTNVPPIKLNETTLGKKETWKIQPYQFFWERWLSGYDMPQLSLVMENDILYVRSTRGLDSKKISLEEYKSGNQWNIDSIFITDFPVGEFERKLIVLDLKAQHKGSEIEINHARIRYPEVKLLVKK